MLKVSKLPYFRPITNDLGNLSQEAVSAFEELYARVPMVGSGSPEGVIDALVGSTYYDIDATTGSIHYIKKQASVGGDSKKGWVLA